MCYYFGPASYLYDGSFNEDLDNYDVVVKINRMVETELCKNFINDRCDVLYHCIDVEPKYGMFQYDLEFIKKKSKTNKDTISCCYTIL